LANSNFRQRKKRRWKLILKERLIDYPQTEACKSPKWKNPENKVHELKTQTNISHQAITAKFENIGAKEATCKVPDSKIRLHTNGQQLEWLKTSPNKQLEVRRKWNTAFKILKENDFFYITQFLAKCKNKIKTIWYMHNFKMFTIRAVSRFCLYLKFWYFIHHGYFCINSGFGKIVG
jgi:hypothetical protein